MNEQKDIQVGRSRLVGLFLRLLGWRRNAIRLTDAGVELLGGPTKDLRFEDLSGPLEVQRRVAFSSIKLPSRDEDGSSVLGVKRSEAMSFTEEVNARWREHFRQKVGAVEPELKSLSDDIEGFRKPTQYPAASILEPVLARSVRVLEQLPDAIPVDVLVPEQQALLDRVTEFRDAVVALRDQSRRSFFEADLVEMRNFYDTIESNPLTPEQRLAVATDEDATLVLAGAGSGKTSVIVAKAAHFIRRGIRPPEEILLMAFGKDAAAEMAARIEDRTGEKVDALTFHALGLSIIREAENGALDGYRVASDCGQRKGAANLPCG